MYTKQNSCCFTGHRFLPADGLSEISAMLENEIIGLAKNGCLRFLAGGALGFDTLAAQTVLRLKSRFPDIRLSLVLPCLNQAERWRPADIAVYNEIKENADTVIYTSESYYRGCMHVRNRRLVDESRYCICYLAKESGGTAFTVNYAKQQGLEIINLYGASNRGQGV